MSTEIRDVELVNHLPAIRERSSVLLMPVMDLQTALSRLTVFQEFCAHYLQESKDGGNDGGDYGVIPGTKKKTLLKSGADKLCELYGLYDDYKAISTVEDWDKGLFDYTLKCILKSRRDDSEVGAGVGSCSSFESKYRWREAKRKCPACGKETIIKGKAEYGGGFICWKKDGKSDGCGAKFKDTDVTIIDQIQGRIENADIIDTKNTVLKMAKKRAKIDAVIGVTRSSGIFTQDMDDVPMPAPKPEPARTTEDIPIGGPATSGNTDSSRGPVTAANTTSTSTEPPLPHNATPPDPEQAKRAAKKATALTTEFPDCIDSGRKLAFARAFKEALHPSLLARADELRHEWESRRGYVDADGNPTCAKIPLNLFESEKRDAATYAKGLVPERTVITDDDIPF